MSVSQSSELNYNASIAQHSSMRFSRVNPLAGTAPITLNSSAQEVQFELPNKVYNMYNTLLEMNLNIPEAVSPAFPAGTVTHGWSQGQALLDRVSIYTREGVYLADIPNFAQYSRAVTPYVTKLEDMLDNDTSRGKATKELERISEKGFNNFRSDAETSLQPVAVNNKNGVRISASSSEADPPEFKVSEYENNSTSYTSAQTFTTGAPSNGAGAGDLNIEYSIPLSQIFHSLASVNRVMYWGQSLLVRVHLNSLQKIGFTSTGYNVAAPANIAAATVSDLRILLAVETNPTVIQGLVNKIQSSGLQVIIPYVYGFVFNSPAGSSSSVQQRLNAGFGQRLLNCYHILFNKNDSKATSMDISNGVNENAKLVSYQSSLDNNNLQEYLVECDKNQDYQLMKPMLKGCLIQNANDYRYNKVHIDSWRKGPTCEFMERDATELDGLELSSERTWSITQNTVNGPSLVGNFNAAQYRQHSYFVCQRTLTISPNGQIIVS